MKFLVVLSSSSAAKMVEVPAMHNTQRMLKPECVDDYNHSQTAATLPLVDLAHSRVLCALLTRGFTYWNSEKTDMIVWSVYKTCPDMPSLHPTTCFERFHTLDKCKM